MRVDAAVVGSRDLSVRFGVRLCVRLGVRFGVRLGVRLGVLEGCLGWEGWLGWEVWPQLTPQTAAEVGIQRT